METTFNFISLQINLDTSKSPFELAVSVKVKDQAYSNYNFSFRYEIRNNKKTLYKSNLTEDRIFQYSLPHTGSYVVRVWGFLDGKEINYTQKTIFAYDHEDEANYERFLQGVSEATFSRNEPELYLHQMPYQIMAVVVSDEPTMRGISEIAKHYNLKFRAYNKKLFKKNYTAVISQTDGVDQVLFSGKALSPDGLIIGEPDITPHIDISELSQSTGNFTIIYKQKGGIVFSNDTYGLSRIFYFISDKITVVSNSYHLLLKLLVFSGEKLELDSILAAVPLLSKEGLFLQQKFSHDMDVIGVRLLPIDSYISISDDQIRIVKKKWKMILDEEIPSKNYDQLMELSIDELKDNVNTLITDQRYKGRIIDVTGGKDSRVILAALSKFNKSLRENISFHYIYANDEEAIIVSKLRNLIQAKWDTLPEIMQYVPASDYEEYNRSIFLGLSFSRGNTVVQREGRDPKYLTLCGGGGDGLYRPYFGLLYANVDCGDTAEKIAENILMYLDNDAVISVDSIREKFISELKKTIPEIAGATLFEKMNNHYIYFRNSMHFGSQYVMNSNLTEHDHWHPLMTKSIILLLHEFLKTESSLRLQLEITAKMNPALLQLPYEDIKDRDQYLHYGKLIGLSDLTATVPAADLSDYKESLQEKARNSQYKISDSNHIEIKKENEEFKLHFFDRLENNLMKLYSYKNGVLRDTLGISLFSYYEERKNLFYKSKKIEKKDIYLYNKISSIVDQIEIINPDKNWSELSK